MGAACRASEECGGKAVDALGPMPNPMLGAPPLVEHERHHLDQPAARPESLRDRRGVSEFPLPKPAKKEMAFPAFVKDSPLMVRRRSDCGNAALQIDPTKTSWLKEPHSPKRSRSKVSGAWSSLHVPASESVARHHQSTEASDPLSIPLVQASPEVK